MKEIGMDYNYHTHTYHCHHATGTPEEYILRAIDGGIRYMGFSEHIPLLLENCVQSRYRMYTEDLYEYFNEISNLREKYRGKIDIKIGFECEYYAMHFDRMLKMARDVGIEYMILGQHFDLPENLPESTYVANPDDSEERLSRYTDAVVEGIKSGMFTYVCHPDVLNFTGGDGIYKKKARTICQASRECGVPLEINFLGMRKSKNYPRELFWQVASEEGAPVVFGFDAHTVLDAYDSDSLQKAEYLVKKYGLNYIGRPKIRKIT